MKVRKRILKEIANGMKELNECAVIYTKEGKLGIRTIDPAFVSFSEAFLPNCDFEVTTPSYVNMKEILTILKEIKDKEIEITYNNGILQINSNKIETEPVNQNNRIISFDVNKYSDVKTKVYMGKKEVKRLKEFIKPFAYYVSFEITNAGLEVTSIDHKLNVINSEKFILNWEEGHSFAYYPASYLVYILPNDDITIRNKNHYYLWVERKNKNYEWITILVPVELYKR